MTIYLGKWYELLSEGIFGQVNRLTCCMIDVIVWWIIEWSSSHEYIDKKQANITVHVYLSASTDIAELTMTIGYCWQSEQQEQHLFFW